ncbi:MAG: DUF1232 domain-containing protein [Polaromonas sp.]|nr:DUF1232 domain-containing protein [Polaromonas sp.]
MKFETLRAWAKTLKRDVLALWIAARDPRTPWYAKVAAASVAAYALSPIDLIPDFIPVIGYLDDLIIVPLGIFFCIKMIPSDLMDEFRMKAAEIEGRPVSKYAAALILLLWIVCGVWLMAIWWPSKS